MKRSSLVSQGREISQGPEAIEVGALNTGAEHSPQMLSPACILKGHNLAFWVHFHIVTVNSLTLGIERLKIISGFNVEFRPTTERDQW